MKTTIVILMIASATALLAEAPSNLVFRGSKIEFSAHVLAAPSAQPALKLRSTEWYVAPSASVVVPAGTNDLIAPARTRQEIIRRMQAAEAAKQPTRATQALRRATWVPASGVDLIGTPADRDRILRDVKISDAPPAQPRPWRADGQPARKSPACGGTGPRRCW